MAARQPGDLIVRSQDPRSILMNSSLSSIPTLASTHVKRWPSWEGTLSANWLSRNNTGIDGPNGFVTRNRVLDNEYYSELVGDAGNLAQGAPIWKQHFEDKSDGKFDDIYVWRRTPPALNGSFIVMTDADIAIVRDLSAINLNSQTGQVSCQFVTKAGFQPTCPQLNGALDEAARYKFSNRSWLIGFEAVLRKLFNTGYSITSNCMGDLCKLARQGTVAGI